MLAFYKTGICEIKSIANDEWFCTINESQSGVIYSRWTPDSRKVLIFNDFSVRMSIWSLIDKSTVYINSPKFPDKGISFSSNGYFMALAERDKSKDYIGIYFIGDWSLVSHFATDTSDLSDIAWSKDDTSIVVWESELESKQYVYSPTGNLLASYEPYQGALGIKSFKFSPNGLNLAVGYYDNNMRIFNSKTWRLISVLNHNLLNITPDLGIVVFKEEEINSKNKYSKYVECQLPYKLQPALGSTLLKGIGGAIDQIEFSFDSNFLAAKGEGMPNVLYIWQVNGLKLFTIIIQLKPIKDFQWSPKENMLLIVTENAKMYTFTLSNVYIVELVSDNNNTFGAGKIIWNSDGKSFIVSDKKQMIIGHPEVAESGEEMGAEAHNDIPEQFQQMDDAPYDEGNEEGEEGMNEGEFEGNYGNGPNEAEFQEVNDGEEGQNEGNDA
ncbi:MAG: WD40 repeat domain-containing protein [archaeon]|nr:WD40 repeat domain-containing protein [archaeon]